MSEQTTQAELDAAQADLERKVGELKDIVTERVDAVRRPFEWVGENLWLFLVIGGTSIALISFLRGRQPRAELVLTR